MCDGRKVSVVRSVALTTSLVQIIGPSQARVALVFSPPVTTGQSYTVTTAPSATLGAGLNLTASSGPLVLTEELFGDAVKKPWFAIANIALNIGFLESIVD